MTPLDFVDYPISHSLLIVIIWSLLFGAGFFLFTRNRIGALLVKRSGTQPLGVRSPRSHSGFAPVSWRFAEVWARTVELAFLTILIEGAIFIVGIVLYVKTKKRKNRRVTWKFWSLIAFLMVIYVMNFMGPPPPSVHMIAVAGQLQWLFVLWGWWADR